MTMPIEGFSKWGKEEKIDWIASEYTLDPKAAKKLLKAYWHSEDEVQRLHDEFIENTITNYYLPLGVAPNFLIDGRWYAIPMAIEESSVVAAASKAAKFWSERGGFHTEILGTEKIGHVHFSFNGSLKTLRRFFDVVKPKLISEAKHLTVNMEKRGGGITDIELRNRTEDLEDYFQLHCTFETLDAMGANFINSCLEQFAATFAREASEYRPFQEEKVSLEVSMSILSNFVPNCRVRAEVDCAIDRLTVDADVAPRDFAEKMVQAITIAQNDVYRAVTHNKGIMNGIDAVVLATGNDFRAIEAGVHAYASRSGAYRGLTHAAIDGDRFRCSLEVPLALGTVGGLTGLHPLVGLALEILGNPSARELMRIIAVAGLAQNYAAVGSLVTTGIQRGHMKMHLLNILNQLQATPNEKSAIIALFKNRTVSHGAVAKALEELRQP